MKDDRNGHIREEGAADQRQKRQRREERRNARTQTKERTRGLSRSGRSWCTWERPTPVGPEGPESQQEKGKGHKREGAGGTTVKRHKEGNEEDGAVSNHKTQKALSGRGNSDPCFYFCVRASGWQWDPEGSWLGKEIIWTANVSPPQQKSHTYTKNGLRVPQGMVSLPENTIFFRF